MHMLRLRVMITIYILLLFYADPAEFLKSDLKYISHQ